MKNIHVLPTDKPSNYVTNYMEQNMQWQNIYITNDEEIKEGDWHFKNDKMVTKSHIIDDTCKKIILTTDQDLIKDGVQAIDDEFLEWFVKNPNCEYIPTPIVKLCENCGQQFCDNRDCRGYIDKPYYLLAYSETITEKTITYCDGYEVNPKEIIIPKEEPKQETLEKASERYVKSTANQMSIEKIAFENGAKWQQKRMYSEEEVLDLLAGFIDSSRGKDFVPFKTIQEYFEQFKKK